MINTTVNFLKHSHVSAGDQQERYHMCLFTLQDLLSLSASQLLIYLPIRFASTTENISSPLFPNAAAACYCSKPQYITHEWRRWGETLIFTLCFPLPTLNSRKSLLPLLGHCHRTVKACHSPRGSSLSKCSLSFLGRYNIEM